jgi:ferricrocin synthase
MSTSGPSPAEQLSTLNPEPVLLPGPELLHHLLFSPPHESEIAIEYGDADGRHVEVTYDSLNRLSDVLATRILSATPSRPGIVTLLLPQCPELYIAQLGVLKAGNAFCALSLDAPAERLKFILEDTKSRVLITKSTLKRVLPSSPALAVIEVDEVLDWIPEPTDHRPGVEIDPSSPAYVMYTSGSTGTPKGVVISHRAVTQSLLAHERHIPAFDRFLQFASPTFDVSVFEIFFPLFRGATLVAYDRSAMLDDLPLVLRTMNVDACELTPTVAASLLRTREAAPKLRLLLTIGEKLSGPVVEAFGGSETTPSILWAMYGPTEAAIHW